MVREDTPGPHVPCDAQEDIFFAVVGPNRFIFQYINQMVLGGHALYRHSRIIIMHAAIKSGAYTKGCEGRTGICETAAAHPAAELAGHPRRRRIKMETGS